MALTTEQCKDFIVKLVEKAKEYDEIGPIDLVDDLIDELKMELSKEEKEQLVNAVFDHLLG